MQELQVSEEQEEELLLEVRVELEELEVPELSLMRED
jgi:hypothetical protein